MNKASIVRDLDQIPENSEVVIDASRSTYIDRDVLEAIRDFKFKATEKNLDLKLVNIPEPSASSAAH